MVEVSQSELPGVGIRSEFRTQDNHLVVVVAHRTGRRELFVCSSDDPDTPRHVIDLEEEEQAAMVELLGGSRVIEQLERLQQDIEGLAIDWVTLEASSPFAGRPLGDTHARTRTGVSIVAILRGGDTTPAPGPEDMLQAADRLIVVGTTEGIRQLIELLRTG